MSNIIAVYAVTKNGPWIQVRRLNRRQRNLKRQRIRSLQWLCSLIAPDNVKEESTDPNGIPHSVFVLHQNRRP